MSIHVERDKASLSHHIFSETNFFLSQRKKIGKVVKCSSKAIDWLQLLQGSSFSPALHSTKALLIETKKIIKLTRLPERVYAFGMQLNYANRDPAVSTKTLACRFMHSSFLLSFGIKVFQRLELTPFSKEGQKNLKLFSNIVSVVSSGNNVYAQITQLLNPASNAIKNVYGLLSEPPSMFESGSKLVAKMLTVAKLIGVRIAPTIFLTLATNVLIISASHRFLNRIRYRVPNIKSLMDIN